MIALNLRLPASIHHHIREIAEAGELLRPDGTMNMLEYVAFLAKEVTSGITD